MDTVRTTGEYKNYFLDSCNEYAIKKNKHVVTGHIHYDRREENFDNCASAGYAGKYYTYKTKDMAVMVIADLHIGVPECRDNIIKVLTKAKDMPVQMVIFLGDTFDLSLTDNSIIVNGHEFSVLSKLMETMPCVFCYGNHDINLQPHPLTDWLYKYTKELNLREYLQNNYNVDIVEEYELDNYLFIHGHQFDVNVYKFKWLYLMAFRITDFINPAIKTIDKLLKKFKLGNR
jgi:predicted MPP superfamily phosphohydrolase